MKKIREFVGYRTLKTAVGATIAIMLAELVGLNYAVSAGVITVLSVQSTKRKSIEIALRRLGSTTIALGIAALVFILMGYSPISFGVYLFLFIPVAAALNLNDGIVPSTVLVTHLLIEESISLYWISNEYGILIIGAGVALVFIIYMPSEEKNIRKDQRKIENLMREILNELANGISTQSVTISEEKLFSELERALKDGNERAQKLYANYLTDSFHYYVKYMEMRIKQFEILRLMRGHLTRINKYYEQNRMVASLTELVSFQFHEINTAKELIEDLNGYLDIFRSQELPKTREEFENRASLYQYVRDLQTLLELKKEFAATISKDEKEKFWQSKQGEDH